jgi:hypothetical protein
MATSDGETAAAWAGPADVVATEAVGKVAAWAVAVAPGVAQPAMVASNARASNAGTISKNGRSRMEARISLYFGRNQSSLRRLGSSYSALAPHLSRKLRFEVAMDYLSWISVL